MDSLLTRYRSIILLLVVLVAQLIFLAYQVKTDNDVRVIRIWAVTVITPIAQIAETTRGTIYGIFHNYFDLRQCPRRKSPDAHRDGQVEARKSVSANGAEHGGSRESVGGF